MVGNELLQGESSFETVHWEEGKCLPSGDWHPLFIRRGRTLMALSEDAALSENVKSGDEVICLKHTGGFLERALRSGDFVSSSAESVEELYRMIAKKAADQNNTLSEAEVLKSLTQDERMLPSVIGHGVAIPHLHCSGLTHRVCYYVALEKPISAKVSNDIIEAVFFVLSPSGDNEGHLTTLGEIARVCRSDHTRQRILAAGTIDQIVEVLNG